MNNPWLRVQPLVAYNPRLVACATRGKKVNQGFLKQCFGLLGTAFARATPSCMCNPRVLKAINAVASNILVCWARLMLHVQPPVCMCNPGFQKQSMGLSMQSHGCSGNCFAGQDSDCMCNQGLPRNPWVS